MRGKKISTRRPGNFAAGPSRPERQPLESGAAAGTCPDGTGALREEAAAGPSSPALGQRPGAPRPRSEAPGQGGINMGGEGLGVHSRFFLFLQAKWSLFGVRGRLLGIRRKPQALPAQRKADAEEEIKMGTGFLQRAARRRRKLIASHQTSAPRPALGCGHPSGRAGRWEGTGWGWLRRFPGSKQGGSLYPCQ